MLANNIAANPHGHPWPVVSITGSVQRFSCGATAVAEWLTTEIDMGERGVETSSEYCSVSLEASFDGKQFEPAEFHVLFSRSPITDAIQFLRSHGMTVEYDTPPERMGMMADFLSEHGHDEAAKVFQLNSHAPTRIVRISQSEQFRFEAFERLLLGEWPTHPEQWQMNRMVTQ